MSKTTMHSFRGLLLLAAVFCLVMAGCVDSAYGAGGNPVNPNQWSATTTYQASALTVAALNTNVIQSEGTVQAAEATADVYRGLMTATAQSAAAEATAQSFQVTIAAATTATAQAWVVTGWTATADSDLSTQTAAVSATSHAWTQQAVDRQATADAASVMALATSQAAQAGIAQEAAEQERIRTQRQDYVKYIVATLPFVLLAVAVALGAFALYTWTNFRIVKRAADGNLPFIILNNRQMLSPDRALDPVTDIHQPRQPAAADQRKITENDQRVQAIRALAQSTRPNDGRQLARNLGSQAPDTQPAVPVVRVIEPNVARPMVGDVVPAIFRDVIEGEEAQHGE